MAYLSKCPEIMFNITIVQSNCVGRVRLALVRRPLWDYSEFTIDTFAGVANLASGFKRLTKL